MRIAARLEDSVEADEATVDYIPVRDPLTSQTYWILDRKKVDPELWGHMPRMPSDCNYKEFEELPAEYRGLYEYRDSKWRLCREYEEHWRIQL